MMIKYINADHLQDLMEAKKTCILNIVAAWCTDCTEQAKNVHSFAHSFTEKGISVFQINVQDEKNLFISPLHQQLTCLFGGHGFPRTILIKQGKIVDADNIEVISKKQLAQLADKFKKQLNLD
ncbi:peroxiredoxin family protein [Psychromonas antarctica]|uniref:peroxiredoxin family protein n=1 Tax=Psychromonas antarctica TaxID=67573 RepID=UPI001EE7C6BB|nr:redoxin domain-containing protein [Psychromonas antarctica]MCG6202554.1 redoxin domain-containing protein [Psychromonas antarctica]